MAVGTDALVFNTGGTNDGEGSFNNAVARYTSTGQLDQTFGTGGKVLTAVSNDSNGYALTISGSKITRRARSPAAKPVRLWCGALSRPLNISAICRWLPAARSKASR